MMIFNVELQFNYGLNSRPVLETRAIYGPKREIVFAQKLILNASFELWMLVNAKKSSFAS